MTTSKCVLASLSVWLLAVSCGTTAQPASRKPGRSEPPPPLLEDWALSGQISEATHTTETIALSRRAMKELALHAERMGCLSDYQKKALQDFDTRVAFVGSWTLPEPRFSGLVVRHIGLAHLEEAARTSCIARPYFEIVPNSFYYRWTDGGREQNLVIVGCSWDHTYHGYLRSPYSNVHKKFYVAERSNGRLVFYEARTMYADTAPLEERLREPCTPVERVPNSSGRSILEKYQE